MLSARWILTTIASRGRSCWTSQSSWSTSEALSLYTSSVSAESLPSIWLFDGDPETGRSICTFMESRLIAGESHGPT
jgi:hypothetical protein